MKNLISNNVQTHKKQVLSYQKGWEKAQLALQYFLSEKTKTQ